MTAIHLRNLFAALLLCSGILVVWGCGFSADHPTVERRNVAIVSVEPHAFLVERLSGGHFTTEVIVPTGKEPESYQPTPGTINAVVSAGVWFQTGMGFEPFLRQKLESLSQTPITVVDLRRGLVLRSLELHSDHADKSHQHDLGCSHDGLDPHIWLSPAALLLQAETIHQTLCELDPERINVYTKNYEQLIEEIKTVQSNLTQQLASFKGKTLFVYHPAYGYFCDEFGLRQEAIEIEGRSPKAQTIAAWIEKIKNQPQQAVIIVQPQFDQSVAQAIAEATGCSVVPHSPLERDILENLQRLSAIITK